MKSEAPGGQQILKKEKRDLPQKRKQKHGLQEAQQSLNQKLKSQKRKNKWLLADEDAAPKENQFLQTKRYTQELKRRQDVSLPFILLHMQMLGW